MRARRSRSRLTEQQQRNLNVRQGELTALSQHPAWPTLEAVIEERFAAFRREIAAQVLGSEKGMEMERQAFLRGFVKGARYVLAVPPNAEAKLEDFLRSQVREEAVSGAE